MDIPAAVGERVLTLGRSQFIKARDEWIRPSFDITGLRFLRDKAARERDVRELYRGRAPYELLQNADDTSAKRAIFVLSSEGLGFAHDGQWFSVANFKSLADGWSDKDPKQCIGHKGLGFRSVLDITPAPHVVRIGGGEFFGFKFTWALNNGHVHETIRQKPELGEEYRRWTKNGQSACPVMAIPGEAKRISMGAGVSMHDDFSGGVYGKGFTTLFWFPARDPDADRQVVEDLGVIPLTAHAQGRMRLIEFLEREVSVLIAFLSNLEQVSLYAGRELLAEVRAKGNRKSELGDEVRVDVAVGSKKWQASFFQMHGGAVIPPRIKNHPETPRAVRQMDKASLRLSVRLVEGRPVFDASARFHVYFPTEEPTGFGFTVHADFFVKPDRTRLMHGEYNNWLLELCATKFANEFLTQLLRRYEARVCFESLRPESALSHESGRRFQELAKRALQARKAPFLPSRAGVLRREEIALPPVVDEEGFWESKFGESVPSVTGTSGLLDSNADSEGARSFFALAGVATLRDSVILDLIEHGAETKRSADWWYEIYSYLAGAKFSGRWGHEKLAGRRLIPDQDWNAVVVPLTPSPVLCLPPTDDASTPRVPLCFRPSFMFVNSEVSKRLHEGPDHVRSWLLTAGRIVQFEATELLPRAIAATVNSFYDGRFRFNADTLGQLWQFLEKIIALSRGIKAEQFWQSVGRLPLPMMFDPQGNEAIAISELIPAFLCYWPDGDTDCDECIVGIPEYRRVSRAFLSHLIERYGGIEADWRLLLNNAGVSRGLKRLRYVRPIGAGREMSFVAQVNDELVADGFTGDRQRDENLVVLQNLGGNPDWRTHVESLPVEVRAGCSLQEVTIVDRLEACVRAAERAWHDRVPDWQRRLWSLIRNMPFEGASTLPNDQGFRRLRGGGGSNIPVPGFLKSQMARLRWGPSSLGPISPSEGFVRSANRRFVSRGTSEDELGDLLVPYVVAEHIELYQRLIRLGFEPLEEGATSPHALARFLRIVGERLAEPWAREAILSVRSRWRLVRGAIQECYRTLNQETALPDFPDEMRFGGRFAGQVEFRPLPLFHVEPGSSLERAFGDALPFFDADRAYQTLFDKLGVTRLLPRESVDEELSGAERAAPSSALRDALVNDVAPHLLSIVIAKSEEKGHRELVLRRLRERFDVYCVDRLTIRYRLRLDSEAGGLERTIDLPNFYLQRRMLDVSPVLREMHFSLYVAARDDVSIWDLDGDALGEALSPVFVDRPGDELASLFPRVVSRFQTVRGDSEKMEQFLLESLGISRESQGFAKDDIAGKAESAPPIDGPPPPAVIQSGTAGGTREPASGAANSLDQHAEEAGELLDNLIDELRNKDSDTSGGGGARRPAARDSSGRPTREQEARGRKGEEEFLRRIRLPSGWMGFTFEKDCRSLDTGFDFLCKLDGREVMVEVKTFAPGGRVIVTGRELKAAAQYGKDYCLIGFIDDGPEPRWESRLLTDPLPHLLDIGKFDLDVKLQANAADVFQLEKSQAAPRSQDTLTR